MEINQVIIKVALKYSTVNLIYIPLLVILHFGTKICFFF